jgi:hypothetical protein
MTKLKAAVEGDEDDDDDKDDVPSFSSLLIAYGFLSGGGIEGDQGRRLLRQAKEYLLRMGVQVASLDKILWTADDLNVLFGGVRPSSSLTSSSLPTGLLDFSTFLAWTRTGPSIESIPPDRVPSASTWLKEWVPAQERSKMRFYLRALSPFHWASFGMTRAILADFGVSRAEHVTKVQEVWNNASFDAAFPYH